MLELWIVSEGEASKVEQLEELPQREAFGREWVAVEATSADEARAAAKRVDAGELDPRAALEEILSTWSGLNVDRLAWHLADLGEELSDEEYVEVGTFAVRFGCPRLDGRSRNNATGAIEAGLSVYLADERNRGEWVLRDGRGDAIGTLLSLVSQGKIPYLVHGRIVGKGSDGEAVLENVTLCGRLEPANNALCLVEDDE